MDEVLKDKKGETVTQALKTIFKEGRKPPYLWTDKGKEFYNKHLKELLDKHNITLTIINRKWGKIFCCGKMTKMEPSDKEQNVETQYLDMVL